jgi:hypothetical protein
LALTGGRMNKPPVGPPAPLKGTYAYLRILNIQVLYVVKAKLLAKLSTFHIVSLSKISANFFFLSSFYSIRKNMNHDSK